MKIKLNLFVLLLSAIDLPSISTDTEATAGSIQQQIQALAAVRGCGQMQLQTRSPPCAFHILTLKPADVCT
jgi:hypothetical protein